MWFWLLSAQLLGSFASDTPCPQTEEQVPVPAVKVGHNESHAASLLTIDNKLFLSWFYGGEKEKFAEIVFSTKFPNSTWSPPTEIANGESGEDSLPVWNPVLVRDKNNIILFYKVGLTPQNWVGKMKSSTDLGLSWKEELKFPTSTMILGPTKNRPLKLSDGNWLVPSSVEVSKEYRFIQIETYDANWKLQKVFNFSGDPLNKAVIQPVLIKHPQNQCIQLLARSKYKSIIQSWTCDGGKTWSNLEKTKIVNPDTAIDALVLKNGNIVLAYNDLKMGRYRLSLALSRDKGKSWNKMCTIKEGPMLEEYSYPSLAEDSSGQLHIAFTFNRKSIHHAQIKPESLQ